MRGDTQDMNLLKELFEAHLGPMRDDIREIKEAQGDALKSAQDAHRRIDKHENRFWGFLIGGSMGGGAFGTWVAQHLPSIGKLLS